ncbi:DUF3391 domain-containing protein [soil metagenome]
MQALQRIEIDKLRIGMHVHLDLGWMAHPFPLGNFKITSDEQIRVIGTLGIDTVRYHPARSDSLPGEERVLDADEVAAALARSDEPQLSAEEIVHRDALAAQKEALALCESQFAEAADACERTSQLVKPQPHTAGEQAKALAGALVDKMLHGPEMCIRLLTGNSGDKAFAHAMNVGVLSLLLARTFGLPRSEMLDVGVGALMHDIGKIDIAESIRHRDPSFSPQETLAYEDHVAHGVAHARRMGLSVGSLLVIAQHHEHADGTGFPMRLTSEKITAASRIVAMVNRYDNLCNPQRGTKALTPHEALSTMFAQAQAKFDTSMLGAFIKMMGVYPPGSTVQLTDDRHALVMSVNAARPLKPCVLVHDPKVPRDRALIVDLESVPKLGIRRSLKPAQLPTAAFEYLSPKPRVVYYFEAANEMMAAPVERQSANA